MPKKADPKQQDSSTDDVYVVPVDPMDDLQCDSCQ